MASKGHGYAGRAKRRLPKMKKLISIAVLVGFCVAAPVAAAPATLTLKASPAVVAYGGSTTLSGVLSTQKTGQNVTIQGQECGTGAFKTVATVKTTTGGGFPQRPQPTMNKKNPAKQKAGS